MSAVIIDGKELARETKADTRSMGGLIPRSPALAVILVGDDPASRAYVSGKRRDCKECGFLCETYFFPAEVRQKAVLELIDILNTREDLDGILVQLPLPSGLDKREILSRIDPEKDMDCLTPVNLANFYLGLDRGADCLPLADIGKFYFGQDVAAPCTPKAVMRMLQHCHIPMTGKRAVVVGRSDLVGKPMALLLQRRDATVTVCHSRTADLPEVCREADVLISAVGKPGLITAEMVKPGAAVIDVGIHRLEDGKLCGDVDFPSVKECASYLTPVPGGVGPMTRAILMESLFFSCLRRTKRQRQIWKDGLPSGPRIKRLQDAFQLRVEVDRP